MWSVNKSFIKYREEFHSSHGRGLFCASAPSVFRTIIGKLTFDGVFALTALQQVGRGDFAGICPGCTDWFMGILDNKIRELSESIPTDFDLPAIDYSQSKLRYSLNACESRGAWTYIETQRICIQSGNGVTAVSTWQFPP